MTTIKKRINISVSEAVESAVASLAKRDQVPQATMVSQLLELALEIEEDTYFGVIAKKRIDMKTNWTDHKNAWN